MNTTKVVSLAVLSIACLSSDHDRRRRTSAISTAPIAPIAPPSVGVATPRKIVPSTRKISASGGISTKVTFCAIADSRSSFRIRLIIASDERDADADQQRDDDDLVQRPVGRQVESCERQGAATEITVSASSDVMPDLPLGLAEDARASGGSAGAHCGLTIVQARTYPK